MSSISTLICLFREGATGRNRQLRRSYLEAVLFSISLQLLRLEPYFQRLKVLLAFGIFGKKNHTKYFKSCDKIRRVEET